MIVYFITFLSVIFVSFFADMFKKKNLFISLLCSFTGILILSYIAGFRAYTIGTDIKVYGLTYFNQSNDFSTLFKFIDFHEFREPLYYALNYLVYNNFHSMQVFLFIHQFILISIVYVIAYKDKKNGSFIWYIITYMLIWYNTSFNIIRQSIALFIVLIAFIFLEEGKTAKYIILILLSFLFHQSALICLMFPIILKLSKKDINFKYLFIITLSIFAFFVFGKVIAISLNGKFLFLQKYLSYLLRSETNFIPKYGIFKLCFLAIILAFSIKIKDEEVKNIRFFIYMVWMDTLFYFSSIFIMYGYRMSYLFLPFYIYFIPRLDKYYETKKAKYFFRLTMILLLCLYWFVRYVNVGYDGTFPYKFFNG